MLGDADSVTVEASMITLWLRGVVLRYIYIYIYILTKEANFHDRAKLVAVPLVFKTNLARLQRA